MTELVRYDAARHAVQECATVDEAKHIADKTLALKAYARQRKDVEMYRWLTEIELRAKRRIGELAAELEKSASGKASHSLPKRGKSKTEALAAAGISKSEAHRCEQIASVPVEKFEIILAEKQTAGEYVTADDVVRYSAKREKQAKPKDRAETDGKLCCEVSDLFRLAEGPTKFGTIYADPAWQYGNQATRGATGDHYLGMSVDEICAMPISKLVADDAHLHLWTTNAFLFDCKRVIEAWGFEYKSAYVWVKPQIGMGNYWRVSHEYLLLGVRGSATFTDKSQKSWGEFPRRGHSQKPEEIRQLVEKVSPGPRLELFARRRTPGWHVWGNEIERAVFDMPEAA